MGALGYDSGATGRPATTQEGGCGPGHRAGGERRSTLPLACGAHAMQDGLTEVLARELQTGRYARFAELNERLAPAVLAWGRVAIPQRVRSRCSPEDLYQEVWLRALRAFDRFDEDRGRFRQWIFGICRHVLLEAIRGSRLERPAADGTGTDGFAFSRVIADASSVSRRCARHEGVEALASAFAELPEEERRLVRMRGLEARDHSEIAEEFGLTPAALRKRWQRLRDRLLLTAGIADLLVED